jgi:hypothetical protein
MSLHAIALGRFALNFDSLIILVIVTDRLSGDAASDSSRPETPAMRILLSNKRALRELDLQEDSSSVRREIMRVPGSRSHGRSAHL